jgi:hypothetical protein
MQQDVATFAGKNIEDVTEEDRKAYARKVFLNSSSLRILRTGFNYGQEE